MIIIEGADGSGKSTLAKIICDLFDYTLIHSPGPIKHEAAVKERMYWYRALMGTENIVVDRCFPISEFVYGPIFRGESFIDTMDLIDFVTDFHMHPRNLLVFCMDHFTHKEDHEPTTHLSKSEATDLEHVATRKSDEIREAYRKLINEFSYHFDPYVEYETVFDLTRIIEHIKGGL